MPAFSSKKNKSMFKQYKTEIKDFDGQKALQFKKIVATTADSDSKHFKLDILIIIKDNYQTDTMIKHNDLTFLIISKTLSMFSYQDVKTTEGKQLLKTTIKRELEKKFGSDTIIDIYFENFVYG